MTELRLVWPVNVTGHYPNIISSTDFMISLFTLKHKKIGIYKMEKPNTKKEKGISITKGKIKPAE